MAYTAVGMQRALDSAIGLPSRSTSAWWMLVLLIPADVRRNLIMPLLVDRRDGIPVLRGGPLVALLLQALELLAGRIRR
jgi:hypothetical protein